MGVHTLAKKASQKRRVSPSEHGWETVKIRKGLRPAIEEFQRRGDYPSFNAALSELLRRAIEKEGLKEYISKEVVAE